jgi:hypothetical protein
MTSRFSRRWLCASEMRQSARSDTNLIMVIPYCAGKFERCLGRHKLHNRSDKECIQSSRSFCKVLDSQARFLVVYVSRCCGHHNIRCSRIVSRQPDR